MLHPDYDLMIARHEIDRRLRESLREYELRKTLGPSPGMWMRAVQWMQSLVLKFKPSKPTTGRKMKHLSRSSSQI